MFIKWMKQRLIETKGQKESIEFEGVWLDMYTKFKIKDINEMQNWAIVVDFWDTNGKGVFKTQDEQVGINIKDYLE